MITAISSTQAAYISGIPGNSGTQAESADARARELRASSPADNTVTQTTSRPDPNTSSSDLTAEQRVSASPKSSDVEQQLVNELAARDREVRNHERAHQSAGGNLTGSASYTYQQGPDGQRYAVGGEVSIKAPISSGDPKADLENAQTILRAALAPAEPSTQDLRVAASARALVASSQAALLADRVEQGSESGESGDESNRDAIIQQNNAGSIDSRPDAYVQTARPGRVDASVNDGVDAAVSKDGNDVDGALSVADRYEQRLAEEEANRVLREQQQADSEQRAQTVAEYQQEMAQLQQRLAEVNQMLAQSGVLDVEYLVGSYINDNA